MKPDDKKDFAIEMATCFQNYTRQVTPGMMDSWFDEMRSFKFFDICYAFRAYARDVEKQPPTLAAILRYAKKSAGSLHKELEDSRASRCYVSNCQDSEVDECPYNPAIMICRHHLDEMILKTRPDSVEAKIIRGAREFESEAKNLGRTNREHFEISNRSLYEKIVSQKSEEAEREKIPVRMSEILDDDITF